MFNFNTVYFLKSMGHGHGCCAQRISQQRIVSGCSAASRHTARQCTHTRISGVGNNPLPHPYPTAHRLLAAPAMQSAPFPILPPAGVMDYRAQRPSPLPPPLPLRL